MQALGINVIRTYAIDTSKDHSACITAFANAGINFPFVNSSSHVPTGIYIISDLSSPGESTNIDRNNPEWTVDIFARYQSVVDVFAQYPNVLGFFAGNEVTNNNSNTQASAFVKAAIRDTKAYIASKNYRAIPVGYSANDDSVTREPEAEYFACAPSAASADFYGINMYEWCGNATYQSSGYEARTEQFANFSIPIFFSEYGCNTVQPRTFSEVQALYSSPMTDVWSGGIVYEWFQETNDYGLVAQSGSTVSLLPDYTALSKQLAEISPTRVSESSYNPSNSAPPCPSPTADVWDAAVSLPPTPNKDLCSCVPSSLQCVAKPNLPAQNVSSLFGTICGSLGVDCSGINANGTYPGQYGAFSPCDATVKLSWLMNKYYLAKNKDAGACDFAGQATTQSAQSPSGTCATLLNEAGSEGTGTVTGSLTAGSGSAKSAASGLYGTWDDFRIMSAVVVAFLGGVAHVVI